MRVRQCISKTWIRAHGQPLSHHPVEAFDRRRMVVINRMQTTRWNQLRLVHNSRRVRDKAFEWKTLSINGSNSLVHAHLGESPCVLEDEPSQMLPRDLKVVWPMVLDQHTTSNMLALPQCVGTDDLRRVFPLTLFYVRPWYPLLLEHITSTVWSQGKAHVVVHGVRGVNTHPLGWFVLCRLVCEKKTVVYDVQDAHRQVVRLLLSPTRVSMGSQQDFAERLAAGTCDVRTRFIWWMQYRQ